MGPRLVSTPPHTRSKKNTSKSKMSCYSSNYPHCYLETSGNYQWMSCSVCSGVRVEFHLLSGHTHPDRVITYPRRNTDGSLDMRCGENRAAADKLAAAEALLAKKQAEAEALVAAEALCAKNLFFAEGAWTPPAPVVTSPAPPSALQLAEQLEKTILAEAKRRVEKERADEEARIQAEAKRRLEAERAAAALRRSDDVEARILAAMEAYRIIQ